jgi:hypothetical protein
MFRKKFLKKEIDGVVCEGRITIHREVRTWISEMPDTDGQTFSRTTYTVSTAIKLVNEPLWTPVSSSPTEHNEAGLLQFLPECEQKLLTAMEAHIKRRSTSSFEQKLTNLGFK